MSEKIVPEHTDAQRLEWLMIGTGKQMNMYVLGGEQSGWAVMDLSNGLVMVTKGHETFRKAIDAAMAKYP